MRVVLASLTVLFTGLLLGSQPLPVGAGVLVESECAAPKAGCCCAPESCGCEIGAPVAPPAAPAVPAPAMGVQRVTLGLPVGATIGSAGDLNAGRAPTLRRDSSTGRLLPLYTLSHAFLI